MIIGTVNNYIEISLMDRGGILFEGWIRGRERQWAIFWRLKCPLCDGAGILSDETHYLPTVCHVCEDRYEGRLSVFRWLWWRLVLSGWVDEIRYRWGLVIDKVMRREETS